MRPGQVNVLLQRFIQQMLVATYYENSMVSGIRIYSANKRAGNTLCPLRAASDRVKVILVLEHDRDHPGDSVGFWASKAQQRSSGELRQKQRKDKSELE